MILKHPDFVKEVTLQEAVETFKKGEQVLVCFIDGEEIYAAQMITSKLKDLDTIRDFTFDMLADAKYYIKGEIHEKTN